MSERRWTWDGGMICIGGTTLAWSSDWPENAVEKSGKDEDELGRWIVDALNAAEARTAEQQALADAGMIPQPYVASTVTYRRLTEDGG